MPTRVMPVPVGGEAHGQLGAAEPLAQLLLVARHLDPPDPRRARVVAARVQLAGPSHWMKNGSAPAEPSRRGSPAARQVSRTPSGRLRPPRTISQPEALRRHGR